MLRRFLESLFKMSEIVLPAQSRSPSLTVSKLTFSDGTTVSIGEADLVVLVGPNNSGKSMALRQIEANLAVQNRYNVIRECEVRRVGTDDELHKHIVSSSQLILHYSVPKYVGYKFQIDTKLPNFKDSDASIRDFFVLRCDTDSRLSGSQPVKSIAYRKEAPTHPIHLLVMDRDLEAKIGSVFYDAFSNYLYVSRAGGAEVGLFVSNTPRKDTIKDDFSEESIDFFKNSAKPLNVQGDGMRSFVTVALDTLATSQQSVLLIDEPEAFLHPPQARMIGRIIASDTGRIRQVFVSTHSTDVLKGIIESRPNRVILLRITRDGDINRVKVLDSELANELSSDPLIRHSGIMDGIFFRHVVICEADTDCQFYSTIMNLKSVSGNGEPDVLFVQGSGKHRINKLSSVASQLGIPFSVIVDLDIINDRELFKETVSNSGGDWKSIEPLWKVVHGAIAAQRVPLSMSQLIASVEDSINRLKSEQITINQFLVEIRDKIRSNSPWDHVKKAGRAALPSGEIVQSFDRLFEACSSFGLWIVPEGELEGFCRTVKSRKGSQWIIELLESYDLESSVDLKDAREFLRKVWTRICSS